MAKEFLGSPAPKGAIHGPRPPRGVGSMSNRPWWRRNSWHKSEVWMDGWDVHCQVRWVEPLLKFWDFNNTIYYILWLLWYIMLWGYYDIMVEALLNRGDIYYDIMVEPLLNRYVPVYSSEVFWDQNAFCRCFFQQFSLSRVHSRASFQENMETESNLALPIFFLSCSITFPVFNGHFRNRLIGGTYHI